MKRKLAQFYLRGLGLLILVIILKFILSIVYAFSGNPHEIYVAKERIVKYAKDNIDVNNYNKSDIKYLFKSNRYYIHYTSKDLSKKDANFNIYYDPNIDEIIGSEYYKNIEYKNNTINRLEIEYAENIKKVFEEELPKIFTERIRDIEVNISSNGDNLLKDLDFNATIKDISKYKVNVYFILSTSGTENIDYLIDMRLVRRVMLENNIFINRYKFKFINGFSDYIFSSITSTDIDKENFDEKLKFYKTVNNILGMDKNENEK